MCNLHINCQKMKVFSKIMLFLVAVWAIFSFSYAWSWSNRWSTPIEVFENVVNESNSSNRYGIQETALDWITDLQWTYARQYKISNTLDYIRQEIDPYLQWAAYIGLVVSTAWLIICGFLLVTWWISKMEWFKSVKWKVINALLWVFILSGFYLIIKLFVWVINMFFGNQ